MREHARRGSDAPSMREADAIAEILAMLARGANGNPGTWTTTPFLCSSPRTGTTQITWSEDVFHGESQVNLEVEGVRHGHTARISWTFSIGRASKRLRRGHDAQLAGLEAARTIRAGCTCSDVARSVHVRLRRVGSRKSLAVVTRLHRLDGANR